MFRSFLLITLFLSISTYSQVTNTGQPKSWTTVNLENFQSTIDLPDFDLKAIQKEDAINDQRRDIPWRFGYDFSVSYGLDNSGQWFDLEDGSRIWLLKFKSDGAKTLNFLFDQFYLPQGASLYFYNEDHSDVLGAYTSSQNSDEMVFGSWLVDGESVYVEYYEPANAIGEGQLNISTVVHGYRSTAAFETQKALNDSGNCNLDVNCDIGFGFNDKKDQLKHSVGLVVVGGSGFCTGSLINNTANNGDQYFLTANHCLGGGVGSWAFRFNWISSNTVCASFTNSTSQSFNQTASGASLRANNAKSDMALLEITPDLPSSWDLVWAGWDRSGNAPSYAVGIHHPSGDIMKVCRDNDGPYQNTVQFGPTPNMAVWYIDEWELGVTEPGSSGSALFDQNGRIIGQLAGGAAACSGTSNNGAYDYYGRFDVSWDFGSTNNSRLSNWLDPLNTGQLTLDQYPNTQIFANDAQLIVNDFPEEICGNSVAPSFSVTNIGSNPINSLTLEYQVNNQSTISVDWTGSLSPNETESITTPTISINGSTNLTASITSVNSTTDGNPANNSTILTTAEFIGQEYLTEDVTLELTTDNFGDETSWELTDSSGNIVDSGPSGGFYNNNTTYSIPLNVSQDECYEFTINDEFSDGICCAYGSGSYQLLTAENDIIVSGGQFNSSETTKFKPVSSLSNSQVSLDQKLSIYPNPASDFVNIDNKTQLKYSYLLYSVTGKKIDSGVNAARINVKQFQQGLYLLQLEFENGQSISKRIIIK